MASETSRSRGWLHSLKLLRGHRGLVAASVVGAIALATGTVYASIPDSNGVIYSCYSQAKGTWRPVDGSGCRTGETLLSWSQTGPAGPAGSPGPAGPAGSPGPAGETPTLQQLSSGDANCPAGGTSITAGGTTTYVCNGAAGSAGGSGVSGGNSAFVPQSDWVTDAGTSTLGSVVLDSPGLVTFTGSIDLFPAQATVPDFDYLALTVRCALVLTTAGDFTLVTTQAGTGDHTGPSFMPLTLAAYADSAGTLSLRCQRVSASGGQYLLFGGGRFSWFSSS